eukprot:6208136-Pleurochrysis_carterae.AAC.2
MQRKAIGRKKPASSYACSCPCPRPHSDLSLYLYLGACVCIIASSALRLPSSLICACGGGAPAVVAVPDLHVAIRPEHRQSEGRDRLKHQVLHRVRRRLDEAAAGQHARTCTSVQGRR